MIATVGPSVTRPRCPVFEPGDPGYAAEVATFHTNTIHTPDLVMGVESSADVVDALDVARERRLRVSVLGGGHGAAPVASGLLIATGRMNTVTIDAAAQVATIGGGARWMDVLAAAEPHGLLPIIGSSSHVGVAGYLLGGRIGPLARTHGFSVDHVLGFTIVTAGGAVLDVDETRHAELFWALRGDKAAPGIVTEIRLRLFPLPTIHAGALFFAEAQIDAEFRGWLDWTKTADPMVTTSAAILTFPDMDISPPPFRGKRVIMLRFAYPGDAAHGAELAAPLRALAPVVMDGIGDITPTQMDLIHMDPPEPLPAWGAGAQFADAGKELADRFLARFGAGTANPFAMAEFRHGGGAVATDVPGGSAVTGRDANYTMFLVSMYPPLFAEIAPAAANEALDALAPAGNQRQFHRREHGEQAMVAGGSGAARHGARAVRSGGHPRPALVGESRQPQYRQGRTVEVRPFTRQANLPHLLSREVESQNLTRPFRDEPDHPTQLEYVKECLRAFGIDFLQYDATRGELEGLKDAKKLPVEFE